jgi:hypothetical protein
VIQVPHHSVSSRVRKLAVEKHQLLLACMIKIKNLTNRRPRIRGVPVPIRVSTFSRLGAVGCKTLRWGCELSVSDFGGTKADASGEARAGFDAASHHIMQQPRRFDFVLPRARFVSEHPWPWFLLRGPLRTYLEDCHFALLWSSDAGARRPQLWLRLLRWGEAIIRSEVGEVEMSGSNGLRRGEAPLGKLN